MKPFLPSLALSVRQPWAWAIVYANKDIENRSISSVRHLSPVRGVRAVHAAKGMTREEYDGAAAFMQRLDINCPAPAELQRGGIIGVVEIVDVVSKSDSPWFHGPRGLVLRRARACAFVPAVGALGYFAWKAADHSIVPPPARWMLPRSHPQSPEFTPDLFDGGPPA